MLTPAPSVHYCPRCGVRRSRAGACDRDGTQLTQVLDSSLLGAEVGNYVVVRRLGEGGMGAVYRAIQPSIGAEVAVKVLHATAESQGDAVQRFLLEAQAVNRVRHPNLIRILDTGYLPDRRPYLVMELLDGITLAEAVGSLSWPLACLVAAEALDALDAVHEEGIVHRDLKPANLFLTRDGRVVVLDFGIAKLVTPDAGMPVTRSGIIGTPEYMAPEQIRSLPLDRRTDVYAMGIVLYETVTGRRPFAAAATFDMLVQHLERPPTSPRDYNPELPTGLADVILCALEKAPDRRFRSARAMATALRAVATATRAELAAFVTSRAPAPAPIPLETPGGRDPGESAAGPTRPEVGVPTTPHRSGPARGERYPRETPTQTVRPSDRDLDPGATLPERPGSARRPRTDAPAAARRSRGVLAVLVGTGLVATGVIVALLVLREPRPGVSPAVPEAVVAAGTLEIKSQPSGARVQIDSVAAGSTPLVVSITAGAHRVEVEHPGHLPHVEDTIVRDGEYRTLVLALPKIQPAAAVETSKFGDRPKDNPYRDSAPAPVPPTPPNKPTPRPPATVEAARVPADAQPEAAPAPDAAPDPSTKPLAPATDSRRKPNPF